MEYIETYIILANGNNHGSVYVRWNHIDKSINDQINNLRNKLIEVVREKQKFTDEEVVRISQQLDELIVKQQTIRFRKRKNSIK